MDDIFYEKLLYRIMQGRLRLKLDGLALYIYEPSFEILEESIDIYDEAYKKAYFDGVPIKKELVNILLENNLWSPLDDREADKLEKDIEDLKIKAFQNFYNSRQLSSIKMNIRTLEKKIIKYRSKKLSLDHISCEGVAGLSRSLWIINKTTFYDDDTLYDWKYHSLSFIVDKYNAENITHEQFRKIARTEPWRQIWNSGKKQNNIFGKPSLQLTKDQLALASFSSLYDNIYENPECPDDKIIDDDDCLDGWMILQKRESDKNKKQKQVDGMIQNSKIANSQEVFIMAKDQHSANEVYGLNDPISRNIIKSRDEQIQANNGQEIKFTKLQDVQQEISIQRHQQGIQQIKGRARGK